MRRSKLGAFFILSLTTFIAHASSPKTEVEHKSLFSGVEIADDCLEAYQTGVRRYQRSLETQYKGSFEDILIHSEDKFGDCRAEFLLGAFDARSMTVQLLNLELLLEIEFTHNTLGLHSEKVFSEIVAEFEQRFKAAMYPSPVARHLYVNFSDFEGFLQDFKKSAFELAKKEKKALPIGRFVFTPSRNRIVRTLHGFVRNQDGTRKTDKNGDWQLVDGTFTKAVRTHWNLVTSLATEYLEWKPSSWFGEDSWVYGSAWRYYFGDREAPSIREIKENSYFEMMDMMIHHAQNSLGLPIKQHLDVQKIMLQKQRAYLERDIATIKAVRVGTIGAIFVPVGIALGSAGLAYAGLSIPAGISSFSISTGAYLSATNVAAASSLIAMVGATTYLSWKQLEHEKPKTLVQFLDTVLPAAVSSFPLAAVTPAAIGGTAAGGKYLYLEGVEFLTHLGNGFKYLRSLGWKGALGELPKVPSLIAKRWISSWWIKDVATGTMKFRKGLLAYYLANVAAGTLAEYVDREFFRDDPEEKFWVDGKINEKSIYSIVPGAIIGLIGTPLLHTDNYISRYIAWRVLSFAGAAGVTFIIKKEVDWDYVGFAMLYGGTAGNLVGEASRVVSLAIQSGFKNSGHKFLFETLFRLASVGPKTWIRNTFMEAYYDGIPVAAEEIRYIFKQELGLEFEGFSDQELEDAFKDFLESDATRELFEKLKELP